MPMLITFRMRFPVCPFHAPLRTRFGKCGHLVEHGVDLGHDVHAVGEDLLRPWGAQGDVQNRALFGDVDFVAREHGVDVLRAGRTAPASSMSSRMVSPVMRFFE